MVEIRLVEWEVWAGGSSFTMDQADDIFKAFFGGGNPFGGGGMNGGSMGGMDGGLPGGFLET